MAVLSTSVSVTTSATLIAEVALPTSSPGSAAWNQDYSARTFALKNTSGTDTVYLDGDNGVANTDFPWVAADGILTVTLEPGEQLYGLAGTTTQTIKVLGVGRVS